LLSDTSFGGVEVKIGDVFRPESTHCNRLASARSPLYGEFTFSDPPIRYKGRCVKGEDEGVDWRIGVFGREDENEEGDEREWDKGTGVSR
jgi:hypothetical protein